MSNWGGSKGGSCRKENYETMARGDDREATGISGDDPWVHRSKHMQCYTCMYYVTKQADETVQPEVILGRCRRHAPTMAGFPAVFITDWCGDHKVDENKL